MSVMGLQHAEPAYRHGARPQWNLIETHRNADKVTARFFRDAAGKHGQRSRGGYR